MPSILNLIDSMIWNELTKQSKIEKAKTSFNKANRVTECDKEKRNEIEK